MLRVERPHRRRAGPHLVIEGFRRRLVGRVADAAPAVAIGLHQPDPAQAAFLDQLARLEQVRRAAALRAHLHHSPCLRAAATIAWHSTTSTPIGFCT